MEKYVAILEKSSLFTNIAKENYKKLYLCLKGEIKKYTKNQTIFMMGDPVDKIGLVLTGEVQIVRDDIMGTRTILASCIPGELFGEAFSFGAVSTLPVSVIATQSSELLFLEGNKIIHTCASGCSFHNELIDNMLKIVSNKNIYLNQKNEILSARSIRKKLSIYFSIISSNMGSKSFEIPFDRQGLADYLSIDRSAMSSELGRMRDEGMIEFYKNKFKLLTPD